MFRAAGKARKNMLLTTYGGVIMETSWRAHVALRSLNVKITARRYRRMFLSGIASHFPRVAMIGHTELIWIFAILFLLFGAAKLPALARSLGKSMREFKKASKDIQDEIERAEEEDDNPSRRSGDNERLND
jgi:sec-independent protein translocase protein TatA